jgi:hypothetical protein
VLRSLDLDLPEQEAAKEFAKARKKALLRQFWASPDDRGSFRTLRLLDKQG